MAKVSEMSEDDAKQHLYDSYMAAHDVVSAGGSGENHPSRDLQRWVKIAATGGENSEKPIEKGEDDEQPEVTEKGNAGNTPAQDAQLALDSIVALDAYARALRVARNDRDVKMARDAYFARLAKLPGTAGEALEEAAIRQMGSATMAADLWAAAARRSNPSKVRAMTGALDGYSRLK